MIDADLQRRVERLTREAPRVEDLDRLYLGLRERAFGRASVRELGNFVAHRAQREKGPITARIQDIFVSFESWARTTFGHIPSVAEARRVAAANLRIATDAQLATRLNLRREVVSSVLEQGLRKLERGKKPTEREVRVVNYLCGAFIWNQVFTDEEVLGDLVYVLRQLKFLSEEDCMNFKKISMFLALYVVTLMHGSVVILENGSRAELFAGCSNDQRRLEIKARLILTDFAKPIIAPVCIFWTSLIADQWCASELLAREDWTGPLEVGPSGLLQEFA